MSEVRSVYGGNVLHHENGRLKSKQNSTNGLLPNNKDSVQIAYYSPEEANSSNLDYVLNLLKKIESTNLIQGTNHVSTEEWEAKKLNIDTFMVTIFDLYDSGKLNKKDLIVLTEYSIRGLEQKIKNTKLLVEVAEQNKLEKGIVNDSGTIELHKLDKKHLEIIRKLSSDLEDNQYLLDELKQELSINPQGSTTEEAPTLAIERIKDIYGRVKWVEQKASYQVTSTARKIFKSSENYKEKGNLSIQGDNRYSVEKVQNNTNFSKENRFHADLPIYFDKNVINPSYKEKLIEGFNKFASTKLGQKLIRMLNKFEGYKVSTTVDESGYGSAAQNWVSKSNGYIVFDKTYLMKDSVTTNDIAAVFANELFDNYGFLLQEKLNNEFRENLKEEVYTAYIKGELFDENKKPIILKISDKSDKNKLKDELLKILDSKDFYSADGSLKEFESSKFVKFMNSAEYQLLGILFDTNLQQELETGRPITDVEQMYFHYTSSIGFYSNWAGGDVKRSRTEDELKLVFNPVLELASGGVLSDFQKFQNESYKRIKV